MGFTGKTLNYAYAFPTRNTPFDGDGFGLGDITVGSGVEVTASLFTIDFDDDRLRLQFTDAGTFAPVPFNGIVFSDLAGTIDRMWSFRLQTNMPALFRRDIELTDDSLSIDFSGRPFTAKTYVYIQLRFAETVVSGSRAADILVGTPGADAIRGYAGDDVLRGEAAPALSPGPDEAGSSAAVRPAAAGNADRFFGGAGIDSFVFATGDTAARRAHADTIMDFEAAAGEVIDLSEWDADAGTPGDQAFHLIGHAALSGQAGELRVTVSNGVTVVEADTDGDARPDLAIRLAGHAHLTEANFLL
jgi:hypothetical protein